MKLHVTTIQLEVSTGNSMEQRLVQVDDILSKLPRREEPQLIILPELWSCGYFAFEDYSRCAEALDGATYRLLSGHAQRLQALLHGGSIIEALDDFLFNTSLLFGASGELLASYRKIHLFGYQSQEQLLLQRGETPVVAETPQGVLGLSTCYDIRFPEVYRFLVDHGAIAFLIVAAWPDTRISAWRLFNQARALENQSWVISCNCAGSQEGFIYGGNSMVVSPMGEIISEAGLEPGVFTAIIDLGLALEFRANYPALADRIGAPRKIL